MKIVESNVHHRSSVLIRFSREQNITIGDITLAIYGSRVNLHVTFMVLDNPSANNVILGGPWIHRLRIVPSTFHQFVRYQRRARNLL